LTCIKIRPRLKKVLKFFFFYLLLSEWIAVNKNDMVELPSLVFPVWFPWFWFWLTWTGESCVRHYFLFPNGDMIFRVFSSFFVCNYGFFSGTCFSKRWLQFHVTVNSQNGCVIRGFGAPRLRSWSITFSFQDKIWNKVLSCNPG